MDIIMQLISKKIGLFITLFLVGFSTNANLITNGDFSTCDYSDWKTTTDGGAGLASDFLIENNGTSCSAEMQVDHFSPSGDPFGAPINNAWLNNTLSQSLDFTGALTSTWLLSIDFSVDSELTSADSSFIADNFFFGLIGADGKYRNENFAEQFLLDSTEIDGAFSDILTYELDNTFTNISGFFLDLQLNVGADSFGFTDAYGSSLFVNNVSLVEKLANSVPVPEPTSLAIFALGLAGLAARKQHNK
jgi:hypothetical protein